MKFFSHLTDDEKAMAIWLTTGKNSIQDIMAVVAAETRHSVGALLDILDQQEEKRKRRYTNYEVLSFDYLFGLNRLAILANKDLPAALPAFAPLDNPGCRSLSTLVPKEYRYFDMALADGLSPSEAASLALVKHFPAIEPIVSTAPCMLINERLGSTESRQGGSEHRWSFAQHACSNEWDNPLATDSQAPDFFVTVYAVDAKRLIRPYVKRMVDVLAMPTYADAPVDMRTGVTLFAHNQGEVSERQIPRSHAALLETITNSRANDVRVITRGGKITVEYWENVPSDQLMNPWVAPGTVKVEETGTGGNRHKRRLIKREM